MANLAPFPETSVVTWPVWVKLLASVAIAWQLASLLAAELGQEPASPLEHVIAADLEFLEPSPARGRVRSGRPGRCACAWGWIGS